MVEGETSFLVSHSMDGYPFWTTGRIRNEREFEEGGICVMVGGRGRSDLKFIPKGIFCKFDIVTVHNENENP